MIRKAALAGLATLVLALAIAPLPAAEAAPAGFADVSITISDGSDVAIPGTTVSYTVAVTNSGPDPALDVAITGYAPMMGDVVACVPVSGPVPTVSFSSSAFSATLPVLAAGETATITVQTAVYSNAGGVLSTSVNVATSSGEPDTSNNSSTDSDSLLYTYDLAVTKTDGSGTYTPGGTITYTVVVTNAGPSDAGGVQVADTLPASLTGASWTAAFSGTGSGGTAAGTGDVAESIGLAVGGSATYTITASVAASASGDLVNTATVSVLPGAVDPNPANNTATDSDTCAAVPPTPWISVYRLFSASRGTHFYTASAEERDLALARQPGLFVAEGVGWRLNPASNADPLYRFYNARTGGHFYTASPEERAAVLALWPGLFAEEGVAFQVCRAATPGAIPVYRFYNKKSGTHFFTSSAAERDLVTGRWSGTYHDEGVAFWLGQ